MAPAQDSGAEGGAAPTGPTKPFIFTSAQGAFWQTGTVTAMATGNPTLTVDAGTKYQTITGFGGAFNERGWKYLSLLSDSVKAAALALLFDATDGANFQYGRIPIGASDYAIAGYTDDEVSSGTDYSMSQFSITEDQQYLIPYVKAALAINPKLHLWGSAWTPPTWMKTGPFGPTPFDSGNMKGDTQTLQAYALYLAKWVQAYGQQAITIDMVVPQNEPSYAEGYPSCLWSPSVFDQFIKVLGPQFATSNLSTQIFLGTMSKTSSPGDTDIMAAVIADSTAMTYVKGFGLQWTMQANGALNFSGNSAVSSGVSSSHLPIWQTEHQCGNYPWGPACGSTVSDSCFDANQAPNDYSYGIDSWGLIRDWLKAGANSYSAWNMVLDVGGLGNDTTRNWPQDALLVVDTNAKTITASPAYFVFRHFSQYIQPGATRVGINSTNASLDTLAFKNPDGSIVTVIYNSGGSSAQTVLSTGSAQLNFSVPANGFATVVD